MFQGNIFYCNSNFLPSQIKQFTPNPNVKYYITPILICSYTFSIQQNEASPGGRGVKGCNVSVVENKQHEAAQHRGVYAQYRRNSSYVTRTPSCFISSSGSIHFNEEPPSGLQPPRHRETEANRPLLFMTPTTNTDYVNNNDYNNKAISYGSKPPRSTNMLRHIYHKLKMN